MIFHDFECDTCGRFHEDVTFANHKAITRAIACEECGEEATMRFKTNNLIHHDHSGMYGQYHYGLGEVVRNYSHKQELLKKYNVVESSDSVGGSRCHRSSALSEEKPTLEGHKAGFGTSPEEAIAVAEQNITED
tara:strand:+ start:383 stop:784 length:402 start_codon:yes stop_codon:yes gene_type:complete